MNPADIRDRLIRVEDLHELLHELGAPISRTSLYASIKSGDVPGALRLGRKLYLRGSVIADWIEGSDFGGRDDD